MTTKFLECPSCGSVTFNVINGEVECQSCDVRIGVFVSAEQRHKLAEAERAIAGYDFDNIHAGYAVEKVCNLARKIVAGEGE